MFQWFHENFFGLSASRHNITLAAVGTRLIAIAIIFVSTLVIPKHIPYGVYDFNWNGDESVLHIFAKWDSAYYLTIAREGYVTEQTYAFFPLYSILIRYVAHVLSIITPLPFDTLLCCSALVISNTSFVVSSHILYKILRCYTTRTIAMKGVVLYMVNPATIFFVTSYSESLFALLSFAGIFHFIKQHHYQAAICFFGAAYTRSNGVFYIIIAAYHLGFYLLQCCALSSTATTLTPSFRTTLPYAIIAIPYLLHNYLTHISLCETHSSSLLLCSLPFFSAYSSLQEQFWEVGWLRRFQIRQLPNFLLATPMIICVVICVMPLTRPLRVAWNKKALLSLATAPLAPHILHVMILTAICFFIAHVQITTRVVASSCPVLYLMLAEHMQHSRFRDWIVAYFLFYAVFGLILQPNNYPWT